MQGLLDGFAVAITIVIVCISGTLFGLGLLAGWLIWS